MYLTYLEEAKRVFGQHILRGLLNFERGDSTKWDIVYHQLMMMSLEERREWLNNLQTQGLLIINDYNSVIFLQLTDSGRVYAES